MAKDVVTLPSIANMEACKKALQTSHNAFPVMNTAGKLVGLVPKSIVVHLIRQKAFYDKDSTDRSNLVDQSKVKEILADDIGDEPLIPDNNKDQPQSDSHMHGLDYDENNGFPRTPHEKVISWREFETDIFSNEADATNVILDVIEDNYDEWIDVRPYMIEHPLSVTVHESFQNVLTQFRINHLRHLLVIDPSNGALKGIVTRKDIFAYNQL